MARGQTDGARVRPARRDRARALDIGYILHRAVMLGTLLVCGSAVIESQTVPAVSSSGETRDAYRYDAHERRDPFRSLLGVGAERRTPESRPSGLPGLLIEETTVKGIVRSGTVPVAMIAGPDGQTYTARVGDRLIDGSIKSISTGTVVFLQQVNDPLSMVKEREVKRFLRAPEDGR